MSSLIGSVSTAVTGMIAQSNCLGNISDNLSNTSTTGYKSIGTNFMDIVASGSTEQVGHGAITRPVYYNNIQGPISTFNTETYMAIVGRGFFTVTETNTDGSSSSSGALCYTRCGDFKLNKDGLLENGSGYTLMGWAVDPATGILQQGTLVPVRFSEFVDRGVPTSRLWYEANLLSNAEVGTTTDDSRTTIYDSAGEPHEISYSWEKTGANTWDLTIRAAGGNNPGDFLATATFTFESSGENIGHVASITSSDCVVSGTTLSFPLSYAGAGTQTVTADFSRLTQFADTSMDVVSFAQNGAAAGSLKNVSVDENGFASINYDNGVIRTYYQIPVATFIAPEGLQRKTGGIFQESNISGSAVYSAAETSGAGKLVIGALENSTVDIADQFTRMIQAQRAYAANAKTVSIADAMLQTLVTI